MVLGRVERLQMMMTADELAAVDDWRVIQRMPSRAAAIGELLQRGSAAEGFMLAEKKSEVEGFRASYETENQVRQTDLKPHR
jgi:hypothetical protein